MIPLPTFHSWLFNIGNIVCVGRKDRIDVSEFISHFRFSLSHRSFHGWLGFGYQINLYIFHPRADAYSVLIWLFSAWDAVIYFLWWWLRFDVCEWISISPHHFLSNISELFLYIARFFFLNRNFPLIITKIFQLKYILISKTGYMLLSYYDIYCHSYFIFIFNVHFHFLRLLKLHFVCFSSRLMINFIAFDFSWQFRREEKK